MPFVRMGGASTEIKIAAADTPAAYKINADFIMTGTNDHIKTQELIDSITGFGLGGGRITLLRGTHNWAAPVSISHPTNSAATCRFTLEFEKGARVRDLGVTADEPILKIESSDATVINPWIEGSGVKGNGYGICFGGDTTNFGGRYTKTVYRSSVWNPIITNCKYGIVFGVDRLGTSSSGDNQVWGGFVTNCKEGIYSAGFTNRVYGTTLAGNNINIHGTGDRNSHMIECYGVTANAWSEACVWLEKDKGSIFENFWAEHTGAESAVPLQAILLGNTTNTTYACHNTLFSGDFSLTLEDETDAIRVIRGKNIKIENLNMSTNGNMPTRSIFRVDASFAGSVKCERLCWMTGTVPATWDYTTKAISRDVAATGKVIIEAVPAPAGTTLTNTTYGDETPRPSKHTYFVDKSGNPNSAIYWAKRRDGHIAAFAADTATTSGLKRVLESLVADNVSFLFGDGRYHYLDAPLGNESWAGVEDHGQFGQTTPALTGVVFEGQGVDATFLSNRTNWPTGTDTEPLSFTNAQLITIRDMTLQSCGFYKASTDTIDFDQGSGCLVERVKIDRSRSRAIICDGGDAGKNASGNIIRNVLIQGRPSKPNLTLVAGGSLTASTVYRYVVSWVDMDMAGANTPGETKASEENSILTDATNKQVRLDIEKGPYSCTARKIYRAPAGSNAWVLIATVADNTSESFTDTGAAGSAVTMPVSNASTIPQAAIEMLGASDNKILDSIIDGNGDAVNGGGVGFGVNLVRKVAGTVVANSNRNEVRGVTVKGAAASSYRILGGSDNILDGNHSINPGLVATKAQHVRIDNVTGATTDRNKAVNNRGIDDQDANSVQAGKTTNNAAVITNGGGVNIPNANEIYNNSFDVGATAAPNVISNLGTNSRIKDNRGHNPVGPVAAAAAGASPYTHTAGGEPEWVYVTGGTVSGITKNGIAMPLGVPYFLEPGQAIIITHTAAPNITRDRL